ncbi:hypothetical protein [Streptomyces sp. NPDC001070]
MATLAEIKALLGEPRFNWPDPAPWIELEQELGIEFPADFREIVNAYGSIEVNGQLHLKHPAGHLLHSLGRKIREDIEFWREEDMAEFLPGRAGADPGELIPVASATTGEHVFLRGWTDDDKDERYLRDRDAMAVVTHRTGTECKVYVNA